MQENVEINNDFMKTLGEIIKSHRNNLNKSIYEISAESSISKSTWREIELGLCKDIKLKSLWKVAEGLNVPASVILDELAEKLGSNFKLSDFD